MTLPEQITTQDLKEFLQMFLHESDYQRLVHNINRKGNFRLLFKLTQMVGEVQHVIVSNKQNFFSVQFIPHQIANAPLPSTIIPDVIVFVDK